MALSSANLTAQGQAWEYSPVVHRFLSKAPGGVLLSLVVVAGCYRRDPVDRGDSSSTSEPATSSAQGESSGSGPVRYGSCKSGSDAECADDEVCVDALASCGLDPCQGDRDCPAPAHGAAVQGCSAEGACVLVCGPEFRCPTGMTCAVMGDQSFCQWN